MQVLIEASGCFYSFQEDCSKHDSFRTKLWKNRKTTKVNCYGF
jgi:hypothetical protein